MGLTGESSQAAASTNEAAADSSLPSDGVTPAIDGGGSSGEPKADGFPDPSEIVVSTNVGAGRDVPSSAPVNSMRTAEARAERERVALDGERQFFTLRGDWSRTVSCWISVLIAFQIGLTFVIGVKALDFKGYDWFLPLVVTQNFLQIVGMGYLVVKFLYPDQRVSGGSTSPGSSDAK